MSGCRVVSLFLLGLSSCGRRGGGRFVPIRVSATLQVPLISGDRQKPSYCSGFKVLAKLFIDHRYKSLFVLIILIPPDWLNLDL